MHYSMYLCVAVATSPTPARNEDDDTPVGPTLDEVFAAAAQRLRQRADAFRQQPVAPERTHAFEQQLQQELRSLGRDLLQDTYNRLEPAAVENLCKYVRFEGNLYTRLNRKTPQPVWTLFGDIALRRVGYRPTEKSGDPTLFPLAQGLGLRQGVTPALAERAAVLAGDAGMTQQRVVERLRADHDVSWGIKKLRRVTAAVAQAAAAQRHAVQVERLHALLEQATAGTGPHKPVLSVGRDGITLGMRCKGGAVFEVATTGTVSVLDRRGCRRGTVYLAYVPELGQATMSQELTRLLQALLQRWQGPLPRLCYVTDAGDRETHYYEQVLARMAHPRTGAALDWIRVVDYYHASERLWVLGEALFGKGQRSAGWVRKMQKWLLKPGGINRVLHSAAAFRTLYGVPKGRREAFGTAYRYLRNRQAYLRYAEYRRWGIPCGSGVTEAACKTVYTQRLKLSGMRWQRSGAQTILDLRVLLLSGVWGPAYAGVLADFTEAKVGTPRANAKSTAEFAA